MMKNAPLTLTLTLAVTMALLLGGCKKTVEGESKAWKRNLRRADKLSALYPGFTAPIKEQKKQAETIMTAAKRLSDEGASAKKMAEANSKLYGGFVYKLAQVDDKIKKLRSQMTTASTVARDKIDRAAAQQVSADTRRVIKEVNERLKKGAPIMGAAVAVMGKVSSDLNHAKKNLGRVISSAKAKQRAKKKAKKSKDKEKKAAKGKAEKAKASWKCSYCDAMNKTSAMKCGNCNAPRGK
jgi:uncharacterized phage infection (PIP) family protein YhgE